MSSERDLDAGFRRILYDAMTLSASLRAILNCDGYPKPTAAQISGSVEAHHMNALIQSRSMDDFFVDRHLNRADTMIVSHFPHCHPQPSCLPAKLDASSRATHTYVAHKSWDAVAKDGSVGAAQLAKDELVRIGFALCCSFEDFRRTCLANDVGAKFHPYTAAYTLIFDSNMEYLRDSLQKKS